MPDEDTIQTSQAVLELREAIKPQILDLIKKQRLRFLTKGIAFVKYSKGQRIKGQFWYCRLSLNHKFLHYGDCQEGQAPAIDELSSKLALNDIAQLVIGKNCPHVKDNKSKKGIPESLSFSLVPYSDQDGSLNFVASNEQIFNMWTDGLNALLGIEMTSPGAKQDLDTLVTMDVKLRLLDTEGITISEPPEIPPRPSNFDFALKY